MRGPALVTAMPAAGPVPHARGIAHRAPGEKNSMADELSGLADGGVRGCEPDGGDMNSGDPGGRSVSGRVPHCPGLTGRSREMPGVATAVQLYGEGDGDKEERLELRARSAAATGQVGRQVSGPVAVNCSQDLGNHANGLLRIRRIGNRPSVVRWVNSSEEIGMRAGTGRPCHHVDARRLRDLGGNCNAGVN